MAIIEELKRRNVFRVSIAYIVMAWLRMQVAARELLRQTGMNLVDVANLTGFVSTSHFSKSYKELYGHSPSFERQIEKSDEAD